MKLILEEQKKYLQSFTNNATYHPMNADADVTYLTVNLVGSEKILFLMLHITFDEISTTLYSSGKGKCTDTCGAMIGSYFRITFLLFSMKIENAVYTSF